MAKKKPTPKKKTTPKKKSFIKKVVDKIIKPTPTPPQPITKSVDEIISSLTTNGAYTFSFNTLISAGISPSSLPQTTGETINYGTRKLYKYSDKHYMLGE